MARVARELVEKSGVNAEQLIELLVKSAAGEDLTDALESAPHGIEFLERFPVVGLFRESISP